MFHAVSFACFQDGPSKAGIAQRCQIAEAPVSSRQMASNERFKPRCVSAHQCGAAEPRCELEPLAVRLGETHRQKGPETWPETCATRINPFAKRGSGPTRGCHLRAGQLLGTEGFESRNRWKLRPGSTLTGKDWRMEGWGWGWGCQCGAEEIMKMLDHPNLVAITVAWFK